MLSEARHENDPALVDELGRIRQSLTREIGKVIVGQDKVIELLLISLFSRGHSIFIGVPGLAKTLLVSTLAEIIDLTFNRVQFTPDLMPADIIGTDVLEEGDSGRRSFRFFEGPVFCNLLLADEINRTPPKTQSALLQAMQELRVTSGGKTYMLKPPFMVLATENPIEQEGTYPLPEAQLDRFMFSIRVDYPSKEEEEAIVQRVSSGGLPKVEKRLSADKILEIQELVGRVPIAKSLIELATAIARMSRPQSDEATPDVKKYVRWGAGPRASLFMTIAAKARAVLNGRANVSRDDITEVALPILGHRIIPSYQAQVERVTPLMIASHLLETAISKSPFRSPSE